MLGIDKRGYSSPLLGLGYGMDGQCRLTRRLRAENLNNPAAGIASHAQCHVKADGACRNDIHILHFLVAHTHDGPLAEVFLYLAHGSLQGLHLRLLLRLLPLRLLGGQLIFCLCHILLIAE